MLWPLLLVPDFGWRAAAVDGDDGGGGAGDDEGDGTAGVWCC